MEKIFFAVLWLTVVIFHTMAAGTDYPPPCESQIYCHGPLLHTVQMARLYKDSKTFVDMKLKYPPSRILRNFDMFMEKHSSKPSKADIKNFVEENFEPEGSEFEAWDPSDWHSNPAFLQNISDEKLRAWADELHSFWKELGRKIKDDVKNHPDMYSMIYTDHPVIVPGGRFREIFYWDSYWIMKGLLLSDMKTTVKGMLSNFLQMVRLLGYVPNGGRIYFRRSQPPLLIPMFKLYTDATNDVDFLRQSIDVLEQELQFWIKNRTVTLDLNGKRYEVARYNVEMDGPRPESYREDFELASVLKSDADKRELYFNLKAAAESGWDFSSRWFISSKGHNPDGKLIDTKTRHVIPVELNSFIYMNSKIIAEFYQQVGNSRKAAFYQNVANKYKDAIQDVFWDDKEGCWFDYDMLGQKRLNTFYASNVVPLWVGAYSSNKTVGRVIDYLKKVGALKERGGVPTSSIQSGEQWDYPNGWAPLQHMLIDALDKSGNIEGRKLAFDLAEKWIRTNFKAFGQSQPNHMFEKYDVTVEGLPGGGGEYDVVVGFGWTNGVVLDFLNRFGDRLSVASAGSANTGNMLYHLIAPTALAIALVIGGLLTIGMGVWLYEKIQASKKFSKTNGPPVIIEQNGLTSDSDENDETKALMHSSPSSSSVGGSSNGSGDQIAYHGTRESVAQFDDTCRHQREIQKGS